MCVWEGVAVCWLVEGRSKSLGKLSVDGWWKGGRKGAGGAGGWGWGGGVRGLGQHWVSLSEDKDAGEVS